MRKTTYVAGTVAATAGLIMAGTPAFADSADNDGINIGNGNNASIAPVQLCGNNITIIGAVVSLASPQANECVNAPIVDHPQQPKPEEPKTPEEPNEPEEPKTPEEPNKPEQPKPESPDDRGNPGDSGNSGQPTWPQRTGELGDTELPSAPAPVTVTGHAAVTG